MSAGPMFIREPVAWTTALKGDDNYVTLVPEVEEATLIEEILWVSNDPSAFNDGRIVLRMSMEDGIDPGGARSLYKLLVIDVPAGDTDSSGRTTVNITIPVGAYLAAQVDTTDSGVGYFLISALGGILR
jgi:hypothetical protein